MASTTPATAGQQAAPAAASTATAAAGATLEEQDTRSRLLNRMPSCIIDFFSAKSKLSSVGGVVPLHWEDGQELGEASTKAIGLFRGPKGGAPGGGGGSGEGAGSDSTEAGQGGSGSGGTLGQSLLNQMQERLGVQQRVKMVPLEDMATVCSNEACGKRSEPGKTFPKCGRCGMGFCCRECQVAAWPQHKGACWPGKLRMHVPAEREVIHSIKRVGVSRLVETMADQLSLAVVAWQARLGRRGLVVAMMENLLYPASPDASQKCQLYAFYVPEKDLPAAQDRIPSLKDVLRDNGGAKKIFKTIPSETHAVIVFTDGQFALSLGLPFLPPREFHERVLREGCTELREMDVYCLDTVEHDRLLIDFHNMATTMMAQVERA